jgi:hypothetical protein
MAALCIIYQHYDLGGESEAFNSNNEILPTSNEAISG